jgi:tRNA-dihydrouridine synthase 4
MACTEVNKLVLITCLITLNSCYIRLTVELAKRCEVMGIAWITVHGRTTTQRAEPVNLEAIKLIKDSVAIPVIANGDIKTEADVTRTVEVTGVDGVMAARGILANPAMYSGYTKTPLQCVQDWVDLSLSCGVTFTSFHHHLMFMMEGVQSKIDRRVFNNLKSTPAVLDFLQDHYGIRYCENNI